MSLRGTKHSHEEKQSCKVRDCFVPRNDIIFLDRFLAKANTQLNTFLNTTLSIYISINLQYL